MPLVSMVSELKKAQAGRYAVPLFNTFEMKGFEGTLEALKKSRVPGIMGIAAPMLERPEIKTFMRENLLG